MEHENTDDTSTVELATASTAAPPEGSADGDPLVQFQELRRRIAAMEALLTQRAAVESVATPNLPFEPDLDVYENDREFLIQAAVPGAEPQHIHIETTAHTVTLTAELGGSPKGDEPHDTIPASKRHRRSRHAGHDRYHFVYTLHAAIVPHTVRAAFRNGIVEIHLVKAQGAPAAVAVPVTLGTDAVNGRPLGFAAAAVRSTGPEVAIAREGSPGQKLGAAYAATAGEDHASKAQSVGDRVAPGRPAVRHEPILAAETGAPSFTASSPAKPQKP